uniref:Uncharacterized protein n=1 Tax=Palpitomonas bilix TaxID=652834 RepID=A0A7S3G636_9EUKA|mmetsp:Transcript_22123/g.57081  ORF Transcript_22123/g.57081 Transcript_22123/m.57081 type:complete len:112 (+) Transcript_22123:232-567(+)
MQRQSEEGGQARSTYEVDYASSVQPSSQRTELSQAGSFEDEEITEEQHMELEAALVQYAFEDATQQFLQGNLPLLPGTKVEEVTEGEQIDFRHLLSNASSSKAGMETEHNE